MYLHCLYERQQSSVSAGTVELWSSPREFRIWAEIKQRRGLMVCVCMKWAPGFVIAKCGLILVVFKPSESSEKRIARFITPSVSLYSKQMLHCKVILMWPRAVITKTWYNNFSFIFFLWTLFFFFISVCVCAACDFSLPLHIHCLWCCVSLVSSTYLERMTHANACFLFWICKCTFDGSLQQTRPGWLDEF